MRSGGRTKIDSFTRACYNGAGGPVRMISNPVINRDPEIMGGTPVFRGTRVPVTALLDYLEEGQDLDEFLDDFPSVKREQAGEFITFLKDMLRAGPTGAEQ